MKHNPVVPTVEVYNHTNLTLEQIKALPRLGSYTNEWRQRLVTLYRVAEGQVISVGDSLDGRMRVICQELDSDHAYALAAWKAGNFSYRAR